MATRDPRNTLKARDTLGKYRIERRVATGGFATVYQAYDTVEGVSVALKIPHAKFFSRGSLSDFRREVRVTASLDHPNILPLKNAAFVDDLFVIAYPLGDESLGDRLRYRLSTKKALEFAEQILAAVAHAHRHRIIHCDIKPDNLILFSHGRLRLSDFGIAKLALRTRTLTGDGTGTLGYLAPEQAFGRPSFRSDVFAIGLVIYRMLTGELPEWPYTWPPPGLERLRQRVHGDFIALLRRALEVDAKKRYPDAITMEAAFHRIRPRALRAAGRRRRRTAARSDGEWKLARIREFRRRYGAALATRFHCGRCRGPVSEAMRHCPWCGTTRKVHRDATNFPARCRRCGRGIKRDWRFCAWCYGGRIQEPSTRAYPDARYSARCANPSCGRKDLMPFMRYCPWCRTKVQRNWKIEPSKSTCGRCGWGILPDYWGHCPWCGAGLGKT